MIQRAGPRRALTALGLLVLTAAWVAAALLLWRSDVPGGLPIPDLAVTDYVPAPQAERAADYQELLRIIAVAATIAQLLALALFARVGGRYARDSAAGPIGTGMLLGMLAMAFAWLAQFPLSMLALWWGRRHDVTDLGYVEGALNDFLGAGGTFLFVSLALLVVMAAAARWARAWWVAAIPALLAVGLLALLTTPYLIPGLERPREARLTADAEELARAQGVDPPEVRILETSGTTRAPNAGATGVGPSERVIVWDTLAEGFARPETRFVLAHEVAHLGRGHVWKQLALFGLVAVPMALAAARFTRGRGGLAQPQAVPTAVLVAAVVLLALAPVRAAFSQRFETEADWIALQTTRDPDAAIGVMSGFTDAALSAPEHPGWASLLLETHPSVIERIELAEAWRAAEGP